MSGCVSKKAERAACAVEKQNGVEWVGQWSGLPGGGGGSEHSFGRERVAAHVDQFQFPFMCHEYKILQLKEF